MTDRSMSALDHVPFVDLSIQTAELHDRFVAEFDAILHRGSFVQGPRVQDFERAFANYCGARHGVAVANGTLALQLALLAHGIGEGDEVITTPATFIATAEAISNVGATPVFADIDSRSYTLDIATIEAVSTPRTRAIIPVDLYGHPADMVSITEFARSEGLAVIEDAAQAHGARIDGRRVGTFASSTAFSFYPSKNLGALGEGGAVLTDDPDVYHRMLALRNHGTDAVGDHVTIGHNYRMAEVQGAMLDIKLAYLDGWNAARQRVAEWYAEELADLAPAVVLPETVGDVEHVFHLYVVRVANRDDVRAALAERGVATGVHYRTPVHLTAAYRPLGHEAGSFPTAEALFRDCVSLPMFPGMTRRQVAQVADALRAVVQPG